MTKWLFSLILCTATLTALTGSVAAHHRATAPQPTQQIVLPVCHPTTCCKLDVPVCIPLCVQGAPCATFRHTLLGPGKTVFTWPCGYEVVVRYTHNGSYRVSAHP